MTPQEKKIEKLKEIKKVLMEYIIDVGYGGKSPKEWLKEQLKIKNS